MPDAAAEGDDARDVERRRGCLGLIILFCTKRIRIRRSRAVVMEGLQGSRRSCAETAAPQPPPPTAATALEKRDPGGGSCERPRDWWALPDLPLSEVARRLHSLRDVLCFRGVCTSWRSVGMDIVMAFHPLLFLRHSLSRFYHLREGRFYRRATAAVEGYVVGQSHGHFIVARGYDAPWVAMNPITGAEICRFPSPSRWFTPTALLSCPPTSSDCVLVGYNSDSVQYCRPGEKEWSVIYRTEPFADEIVLGVAIVGGKGYVLLWKQGLATFDFLTNNNRRSSSSSSSRRPPWRTALTMVTTMPHVGDFVSYFLAESHGELLALPTIWHLRHPRDDGRPPFVARIDPLSGQWVESEDLGGRAVFVRFLQEVVFVDGDRADQWGASRDCIYYYGLYRGILKFRVKDAAFEPFRFPSGDGDPYEGNPSSFWLFPVDVGS